MSDVNDTSISTLSHLELSIYDKGCNIWSAVSYNLIDSGFDETGLIKPCFRITLRTLIIRLINFFSCPLSNGRRGEASCTSRRQEQNVVNCAPYLELNPFYLTYQIFCKPYDEINQIIILGLFITL